MPRSLGCTLTLLLLSALPAAAGVDRWTPIGPDGGTIPALAADSGSPGTIYAGSDGSGVWKSTDGGGHWFSASDGLAERGAAEVAALAVAPGASGTVWAGTHAGIYKTTDGGATWGRVWNDATWPGDAFPSWIVSLTADPGDPGVAWAGTAQGRILKTTDGGESWNQVLDLPGKLLFDPAHPDTVYAYGDGLYKSTDGGATWELIFAGAFHVLALDPADSRVLYSGGHANASLYGVWKSVDGGATWSHRSTLDQNFVQTLLVDPSDPSVVLAGTSGYLWRSEDAGTTWQRVPGLPLIQVLALEADPARSGRIWLGANDRGVFRSFDSGRTWRTGRQGLAASHLWSAAFDPFRPRTLYAVANNMGVHRSVDAGAVWNRINAGLPTSGGYGVIVNTVAAHPLRPGTLFAATEAGAYRSLDRGAHWSYVSARFPGAINSVAFDPGRPETIFAGGENLLRSRDGGRTWKRLSLPGTLYEPEVGEVFIAPLRPRTVFVLDFNQRRGEARSLFRSPDGGNTWTLVFERGPAAIAPHPTVPGRLYLATESGGEIWTSADDGVTWEQVASEAGGGARLTSLLVDRLDPSILYLGTEGAGVLRSQDGGVTWAPLEAGMIAPRITCLAADPRNPRHLVACTQGGGLLEIRLSD